MMARPPKTVKITKDGVTFEGNFGKAAYTIRELTRAAQYDTAKLIRKRLIQELKQLPGMRRNRRIYRSTQYWVRGRELDLQIGFKHDAWYGVHQEKGTRGQPARGILRNTVMKHITDIRRIQGQYLSAVEQENRALGLINENEYKSPDGPE